MTPADKNLAAAFDVLVYAATEYGSPLDENDQQMFKTYASVIKNLLQLFKKC